MCTVTWLREDAAYHLFFNRDELRTRRPAEPPQRRTRNGVDYLAPTDGNAGGTWLAANAYGVTLGLLNGYQPGDTPTRASWISRGLLVDSLADADSPSRAFDRLGAEDLGHYRSFWLLALSPAGGRLGRWNGREWQVEPLADDAMPLVSSSFETASVGQARRRTFRADVAGPDRTVETHLAFHAGHRPARGPYSVCMHRPDAKTVSFSWVRVDASEVRICYTPASPHHGIVREPVARLPHVAPRPGDQ